MEWELLQHLCWSCSTHQSPTACSRELRLLHGALSLSLSLCTCSALPTPAPCIPSKCQECKSCCLCCFVPLNACLAAGAAEVGGKDFCHTAPSFPVFNILGAETWKNSLTELMFTNSRGSSDTKCHHKLDSPGF